jgi:hypothetical protein
MSRLFLFLKGMTGALAPFSYLVLNMLEPKPNLSLLLFKPELPVVKLNNAKYYIKVEVTRQRQTIAFMIWQ